MFLVYWILAQVLTFSHTHSCKNTQELVPTLRLFRKYLNLISQFLNPTIYLKLIASNLAKADYSEEITPTNYI
jgi:hypothetical protein